MHLNLPKTYRKFSALKEKKIVSLCPSFWMMYRPTYINISALCKKKPTIIYDSTLIVNLTVFILEFNSNSYRS